MGNPQGDPGRLHPKDGPAGCDRLGALVLSCFRRVARVPRADDPGPSVTDWHGVATALEAHGLIGVLATMAGGQTQGPPMPADVQQQGLRDRLRLALHHANALEALQAVDREMTASGVPYAVLKGAYLYELLYGDLFPREYGDTDLLIPSDRVEDAVAALKRAGYEPSSRRAGGPSMPRWHFHLTLTSSKPGGLPIELHRALVDRANLYRLPDADLFGRLRVFSTRRARFTVLSAEDELLYLCLHAAKHGSLNYLALRGGYPAEWFCGSATGNRLVWFLDIELFLRKEQGALNWPAVAARAQQWNIVEDVVNSLRVLALLQPDSQAAEALRRLGAPLDANRAVAPGRGTGALGRLLRSRTGLTLLERSVRTHPVFVVRPIRLLIIGRDLLPSPARLLGYHGRKSRLWLPWLYLIHPVHMVWKMLVP